MNIVSKPKPNKQTNKMYTRNEKNQHISESMHVNEVFENILNSVKFSNLNFYLQQTPFAATISIKKGLIKDKFGAFIQPLPLESEILSNVKIENYAICYRVNLLESYSFSLQSELHGEESRDRPIVPYRLILAYTDTD